MPGALYLKDSIHQQIVDHLEACLPHEGCGFVAGREGIAEVVLPVTNQLHSAVRYRMDPAEQLQKLIWLEDSGLTVLAIFHSHPAGPDFPSETDLAEFTYLDTITLIFSKRTGAWQARGYHISGRSYQEIPLVWE